MDNYIKWAHADRVRINVGEDYELRYWAAQYRVTPEQLRAVVRKVGMLARDVEAELKRHRRQQQG